MNNNIYKHVAHKITIKYIVNNVIPIEDHEMYSYGFEVLLSTITNFFVLFVVSIFTNTIISSLFFFTGFILVRNIAGGYHANTYLKCHILTCLNHCIFILMYNYVPIYSRIYFSLIAIILSAIMIIAFSPVDNKNKRFIKNEKKRFRIICMIYASLLIILFVFLLIFIKMIKESLSYFIFSFALGTLSASSACAVVAIKNRKERKNEAVQKNNQ